MGLHMFLGVNNFGSSPLRKTDAIKAAPN